ncbi:MAG: VOC family protein [Clostridiales bacterium]|nr:VOC family protein [Clostridiales bacterium]
MENLRMHHVGIVMMSRERAEDFLRIFGFEIEREEYVEVYAAQCIFTKHRPGETAIELIVPDRGVLTQYNGGKGGLHHIALETRDAEATRARFEKDGRGMLEKAAVPGACGIIVNFLRPRFGAGILVEFVERVAHDAV